MKNLILSLVMIIIPFSMSAQEEFNKQEARLEPEFNNQACILNADSTTTLLPLESVDMKGKSTAWGLIPIPGTEFLDKSKMYVVFKGNKSQATTKPGNINIILKVKDNNDDPRSALGFMLLEVKKNRRRAEWMSFGLLGSKMNFQGLNNYNVRKFGKSSYLITLDDVKPGQYAIGIKNGAAMATFGVE